MWLKQDVMFVLAVFAEYWHSRLEYEMTKLLADVRLD